MKKLFIFLLTLRAHRVLSRATSIIGITGSVGKTSTRMAIAHLLSAQFRVQTSPQNFNTPFGLLLAILEKENIPESKREWLSFLWNSFLKPLPKPEILVLEYGVDAPGDMDELLPIATPDIAVLTPIAPAHLAEGQFASVEDIRREKLKLARSARKIAIANTFDTETWEELQRIRPNSLILFGTEGALVEQVVLEPNGISFLFDGEPYQVPLIGSFQAQVVAPAILIARMFGIPLETIRTSLSTFTAPPGRGRILEGIHHSQIWDFSYNASPTANAAVLSAFGNLTIQGKKIALLGNMNELGKQSFYEHVRLGEIAAQNADEVVFVGENAEAFRKGVAEKVPLRCFDNAYQAGEFLKKHIQKGDFLLAKGSQNTVFLEEAVRLLLQNPKDEEKLCRNSKRWKEQKGILTLS